MDKPIDWRGSSLDDLREFPEAARKMAGQELRKLQRGETPDDWRPFSEVGPGVNEIRIDCADGWFRVMYVASRKTSKGDIAIAEVRYRAVVRERMGSR